MAEETKKPQLLIPPCFGRAKYYTSFQPEEITKDNVVDIVKIYFTKFTGELGSLYFLENFLRGRQPVLDKTRDDESAENYKIVVNLARTARNNIKHAFIGEETQYLPIEADNPVQKSALKDLLKYYRKVEEPAHNARIESDRGVFGYAYEQVLRKDGAIKLKRLKPTSTSIVYSEDDEDEKVFAYNFYRRYDEQGKEIGWHINVYTKYFAFSYNVNDNSELDGLVTEIPNELKLIPIVEYGNNDELMGDFEPSIPVLNALNMVYSKRLDNISDIVDALLVFLNSSIYEEKTDEKGNVYYDDTHIKAMKKNRVVELHGEVGLPADIKHIVNTLDQSNTQIVCDNLARLAYVVMGVPDAVNSKSSGGGDTGEAANTREGYKSFNQLLNDKERLFKKGLKERIELIRLLSLFDNSTLKFIQTNEIDIRFIRQKSLNDQSEAQMIATLNGSGLFSPDTVITQSNLCESPQEEIDKVMAIYKSLKDKGVFTEEQYNRAVASYYIPTDKINIIFASSEKGEDNGEKLEKGKPIQSKKD